MARKSEFENDYRLPNVEIPIDSEEELDRILNDFEYFMANYQQIVDKSGQTVPFKLNEPQKRLAKILLPMVMKETRLDRRHNLVVLKCRQMGASVEIVALINYICAFVEGMNNMNIVHVFPIGDSGGKFYESKVKPIVRGVHPDIYPNVERTFTSPTSRVVTYHDTQGVRRNNRYEVVSANASSIRGGTAQIALLDEVADYSHPYDLEAALSPAIPDFGFSLVVFLSTFSDKRSSYFLEKIKIALEDQDNWTILFIPWYLMYPEMKIGIPIEEIALTPYDKEVILPALEKDGIPEEEWGDAVMWYHRKAKEVKKMKQEYPTTVQEVLELGSNERAFLKEDLDKQLRHISKGERNSISTGLIDGKPMLTPTEDSPFCVYKKPLYGHRYIMTVDPITSVSEDSDFFCASVFDTSNNEQVATLRGRGLQEEDWAVYCVAIAKYYNRCLICPESNVAEGFRATAWNLGYYNWYYVNAAARKNRTPGIRTTAASKENMLQRLEFLLRNENIIIHDKTWLDELNIFERKVKKRDDNSNVVTYAAPKGQHDDTVSTLWIYAGTLDNNQLAGRRPGKIVVAAG